MIRIIWRTMNKHKVFVYGTLRPRAEEGKYLPATHFLDGYMMYSVGSFPYIVPSNDGTVLGTVVEVDDEKLAQLDYFEGVKNGLYERVELEVRSLQNHIHPDREHRTKAYVYVGGRVAHRAVVTGDWADVN